MIAEAGNAALWLAAGFALLAAVGPRTAAGPDVALPSLALAALLTLCALVALIWCFEAADFSLILVDDRVHRLQPPMVRLAALAGSFPGWLLVATTILGLGALVLAVRQHERAVPAAIALALPLLALLVLRPFARQPIAPPEGRALSLPNSPAEPLVLAALAAVVVLIALARPSRRWWLAGGGVLIAGLALALLPRALTVETSAVLRPGESMRLQGFKARLVDTVPTAGPGFTAIEARLAVDDGGAPITLRPQARTLTYATTETPALDAARLGGGRIEATLGRAIGDGREVRLRWRPLL